MEYLDDKGSYINIEVVKRQVLAFLILTFGVTYMLNFLGLYKYGPITSASLAGTWNLILAAQMLFPADCAIICLALFKDEGLKGSNKLFLGYFMVFFIVTVIFLFYNPVLKMPSSNPALGPTVDVPVSQLAAAAFGLPGFILLIVLNIRKKSREHMELLGLSFGRRKYLYLVIPVIFAAIFTVNITLNRVFNLADPSVQPDFNTFAYMMPLSILNGILASWMYFFGEEFGWRAYLHDRMTILFGPKRGAILIGIIWGLWHAPVIAMGYNYPGYPLLGIFLMIIFCVIMGIYYSYSVFKTGSVWIASLLHLVTNTVLPLGMMYIAKPKDMAFSFGIGVYGLMLMGVFSLIILKVPGWMEE